MVLLLAATCVRSDLKVIYGRTDDHDRVYVALQLRHSGCPKTRRASCCATLESKLDAALASDDMMIAANYIDALAISCLGHRARALAALAHTPKPLSPREPGGELQLRYELRLAPTDRLYWAGAFVDHRYPASLPLPAGEHELVVQFHIMTTTMGSEDSLYRLQARNRVEVPASGVSVVTVRAQRMSPEPGAEAFLIDISQRAPVNLRPPSGPSDVAKGGQLKNLVRPRQPREFAGHPVRMLQKVCVNTQGRVESVSPILPPPHPRYLGTVLDFLAHFEYQPYEINHRPSPFCYRLRINFK